MDKYQKAELIYEEQRLFKVAETRHLIWFRVKSYWTVYYKRFKRWSCTCLSWQYKPHIECSHILAANRLRLR